MRIVGRHILFHDRFVEDALYTRRRCVVNEYLTNEVTQQDTLRLVELLESYALLERVHIVHDIIVNHGESLESDVGKARDG